MYIEYVGVATQQINTREIPFILCNDYVIL